jgi:hypothetical protein
MNVFIYIYIIEVIELCWLVADFHTRKAVKAVVDLKKWLWLAALNNRLYCDDA